MGTITVRGTEDHTVELSTDVHGEEDVAIEGFKQGTKGARDAGVKQQQRDPGLPKKERRLLKLNFGVGE